MTAAELSLRAALAERKVIVVAGAGTSLAATGGAPTASWPGLLRHGIDRVTSDCAPDARWLRVVKELLARDTPEDFLRVASMIKDELGHSYPHWLSDVFTRLTVTDDAVPKAIAELGVPVATTNFDTLLEDVSGRSSATWQHPHHMHSIFRGVVPGIAHLHGVWTDPDSIVFDRETYAAVLRTDSTQVLQQVYAVSHSLLFVGVGHGGHDPNIGGLLHWFAKMGWPANPHYWLCLNDEVSRVRDSYPVEPVPYGDDHAHLATFLRSLVTTVPPAPSGVPAVEPPPLPVPAAAPRDLPAPEPWFVTPVSGPWCALTDGVALRIVTAEVVGARGLTDIAVVAEGSHLVALDEDGFRVWVLNLDGTLTEWPATFGFDVTGMWIRSARRVDANAIDVFLRGGPIPRVRLEARRPVVRAVLGEDGTPGGPLRDSATGAFVTVRAELRDVGPGRTTLSIQRDHGTESARVSFETGPGCARRVVVARPLRGRTEPDAVVTETDGTLRAWRWRDVADLGTTVGARAEHP